MSIKNKPLIICLTPIKNEAWILDRFLQCASLWADYIIISDQMSTDGSREIARKYPKVKLVDNLIRGNFDEYKMRNILFETGRKIQGDKIFICIDADEVLSSNFMDTDDWQNILKGNRGDTFALPWINLCPDFKRYWLASNQRKIYIDDGTNYSADIIHTHHVPISSSAQHFELSQIKLIHYQYTDWERMYSKHRWYQCFERLNRPFIRPLHVFRMYHHMYGFKQKEYSLLEDEWLSHYEKKGINMKTVQKDTKYRWDDEIEALFDKYGKKNFSSLAIWDNVDRENDPRNFYQRLLHRYLFMTQIEYRRPSFLGRCIRFLDKFLKYTL